MKGICLKEPLFHATIEGRKTQTRRIMNPQPDDMQGYLGMMNGNAIFRGGDLFKPRYNVSDVIYLKEPYSIVEPNSRFARDGVPVGAPLYKYNFRHYAIKWKNKLFMPAEAARHFIRITAVRAERLQDISEEDCFNEGIVGADLGFYSEYGLDGYDGLVVKLGANLREAYAALIDKINGRGTWDSNPWVWVYDYELCEIGKDHGIKA